MRYRNHVGDIINLDLIQNIYVPTPVNDKSVVLGDKLRLTDSLSDVDCRVFVSWLWRKMEEGFNFLTYDDYVRVYPLTK